GPIANVSRRPGRRPPERRRSPSSGPAGGPSRTPCYLHLPRTRTHPPPGQNPSPSMPPPIAAYKP
ncbi:conserved hypothetical protein, partial [Ricinus communis]